MLWGPVVLSAYARNAKPTYAELHRPAPIRRPTVSARGLPPAVHPLPTQQTKKKAALRAAFVIYHHMLCTAGTVMFSSY